MSRASRRAGVVLLEVLVSLAILGVVGASAAMLATDATNAVHRAQRADDEIRRASALLDAVALWPREDLDRHIGARPQGEWLMEVAQPATSLYTVVLRDSTGRSVLLGTALFRAAEPQRGIVDVR